MKDEQPNKPGRPRESRSRGKGSRPAGSPARRASASRQSATGKRGGHGNSARQRDAGQNTKRRPRRSASGSDRATGGRRSTGTGRTSAAAGTRSALSQRGERTQRQGAGRRGDASRTPRDRARARQVREHPATTRAVNRRLLGIMAVAVVLIIVVSAVLYYVMGKVASHSEAQSAPTQALYTPTACSPDMLDVSLAVDGSSAGGTVAFTATLTNRSETNPCVVDVGWGNTRLEITSGGQHMADPLACKPGSESKRLLLDRKMSTTVTVAWSGKIAAEGCPSGGRSAGTGTYAATYSFTDSSAKATTVTFALGNGRAAEIPTATPSTTPEPTLTVTPDTHPEGADAAGTAPADEVATAPATGPSEAQ